MRPSALIWIAVAAGLWYWLTPKSAGAVATIPDTAGNYPPMYPDFSGSGALDSTGAQWPGWATPPFNPTGYPAGGVQTGYGDLYL